MVLRENSTVFDVLACLCALLDRDDERESAIQWTTASRENIKTVLAKYKNFMSIIMKATLSENILNESDIRYMNDELWQLQQEKNKRKSDIYLLAIEIEHRIEKYTKWQNQKVVYEVKPLNTNVDLTSISIYPCTHPRWEQKKSERNRERTLNACFTNFMLIRNCDSIPFEFVMHYWNDTGMLKSTEKGWSMSVALSPVMDNAMLKTCSDDTDMGKVICVEGLDNGDTVLDKVLQIFDEVFERQYSIIVFPEALGTQELVCKIKTRMRVHPEYCTFVLLPTICENGANTLVVLGPGGVECLVQNKVTPFILLDKDGVCQRENLVYDKQVHLLITEELGLIAFPICADLLDPAYYHAITSVARIDTIICPSFSPGGNAFKETMLKGMSLKLLEFYVNTCSAKVSSRSGLFEGEVAMIQMPYVKNGMPLQIFEKSCDGKCSNSVCYFDLTISCCDETFVIEGVHRCA